MAVNETAYKKRIHEILKDTYGILLDETEIEKFIKRAATEGLEMS